MKTTPTEAASLFWKRALVLREMQDTLGEYQLRGYDVSSTSTARLVIMCRVAEKLAHLGVLCIVKSTTQMMVFP